jgi:hypothetical protein
LFSTMHPRRISLYLISLKLIWLEITQVFSIWNIFLAFISTS